jgi:hypothetical protein
MIIETIVEKELELESLKFEVTALRKDLDEMLTTYMSNDYTNAVLQYHDDVESDATYANYLDTLIRVMTIIRDSYPQAITTLSTLPL